MDQGYAWVILAACTGLRALVSCPDGIMGVLLLDLRHRFEASEALLNATVSMQFGATCCFGKISAHFYDNTFLVYFTKHIV